MLRIDNMLVISRFRCSAVGKHCDRLGEKADQKSVLWRTKQLEYTWLRNLMKPHVDFWKVPLDALDFSFDMHGISDTDLRNDLIPQTFPVRHADIYTIPKKAVRAVVFPTPRTA